MADNYVYVMLNTGEEKKNLDILATLDYPQRFGYPVMVILDQEGKRIHTQNSVYLEKEKSYDEKTVVNFLKHWSPAAVDPKSY